MKKKILIVDLDKTVFDNRDRDHLVPDDPSFCPNWDEWSVACTIDTPIKQWVDFVEGLASLDLYDIKFMTSRAYICEQESLQMISKHLPEAYAKMSDLIMRENDNHLHPVEFKMHKLAELGPDNIAFIIDDDKKICEMALGMGIPTLNVNPKPHVPTQKAIHARSMQLIRKALGESMLRHVDVKPGELLCNEHGDPSSDHYMCHNILIEAKEDDTLFAGLRCFVQVEFRYYESHDCSYQMIFGEDTEENITRGNIFEYMFYCLTKVENL